MACMATLGLDATDGQRPFLETSSSLGDFTLQLDLEESGVNLAADLRISELQKSATVVQQPLAKLK